MADARARRPGVSTRAVHAGEGAGRDLPDRRPASVPIFQTAPWTFDSSEELGSAFAAVPGERSALYSRYENPTVRALEEKVAALERADDAVALASGMAAISTTLGALLVSGDRLLAAADLYGGTDSWLASLAAHHPEVTVERVGLGELPGRLEEMVDDGADDLAAVYLETPSNPLLACCDVAALARLCRRLEGRRGERPRPLLVVDGTLASPAVQTPVVGGADLVIHSATKFLAGHSDVTAGVVAGGAEVVERVRRATIDGGATLDPHAAFLVARGLKTLGVRLERAAANARRLAGLLDAHPAVAAVHYPGFDPVGRAQMLSGGAMLAFEFAGGLASARALVDALEVFRIIPSLGGVESGVVLPAVTSHRQLGAEERAARGIADGLVRASVGIEDGADLEADLERGLAAAAEAEAGGARR